MQNRVYEIAHGLSQEMVGAALDLLPQKHFASHPLVKHYQENVMLRRLRPSNPEVRIIVASK